MNSPLQRMGRDSSHPQADPSQEVKGKKKSACSVRNDGVGLGGAGYPGLTAFVALRVRPEGLTYDCDARPALQNGWRDELAATRMGRDSSRRKRGMGRRSQRLLERQFTSGVHCRRRKFVGQVAGGEMIHLRAPAILLQALVRFRPGWRFVFF